MFKIETGGQPQATFTNIDSEKRGEGKKLSRKKLSNKAQSNCHWAVLVVSRHGELGSKSLQYGREGIMAR